MQEGTNDDTPPPVASISFPRQEPTPNSQLDDISETQHNDHEDQPDSMFSLVSVGPAFDLDIPLNQQDSELNEIAMEILARLDDMQNLLDPANVRREDGSWFPVDADVDHPMEKGIHLSLTT